VENACVMVCVCVCSGVCEKCVCVCVCGGGGGGGLIALDRLFVEGHEPANDDFGAVSTRRLVGRVERDVIEGSGWARLARDGAGVVAVRSIGAELARCETHATHRRVVFAYWAVDTRAVANRERPGGASRVVVEPGQGRVDLCGHVGGKRDSDGQI
jgi:hypothetical protein